MKRVYELKIFNEKMLFFIIAIFRVVFYIQVQWGTLTWDSYEMINVDSLSILRGELHDRRVPIYPFILDLCHKISKIFGVTGDEWIKIVVICQMFCSFIAVIYFYKFLKKIKINGRIAGLITFVYSCTPIVMGYDTTILTESFSLSGIIFVMYFLSDYLCKKNTISGIVAILLSGVLTFLRPSLVILIIILSAFFGITFLIYKVERAKILKCIKWLALIYIIVISYMIKMNLLYNCLTLSTSLLGQELVIVISQDLWKFSSEDENINIKEHIKNSLEADPTYIGNTDIIPQFGTEETKLFLRECRRNGFFSYLKYISKLCFDLMPVQLSDHSYYINSRGGGGIINHMITSDGKIAYFTSKDDSYSSVIINTYEKLFPCFAFIHVYILCLIEGVIVLATFIKRGTWTEIQWIHLGLFGTVFSTFLLGVFGTYAEWGRTIITILPSLWSMVALILDLCYRQMQIRRD